MFDKLTERSFLSPVVAFTFLPVAFTGILMLLHMHLPGMKNIHQWVGLVFTVFCIFHIVTNWKPFAKYLGKGGARTALVLALVLIIICGVFGFNGGEGGPGYHGGRGAPKMRGFK